MLLPGRTASEIWGTSSTERMRRSQDPSNYVFLTGHLHSYHPKRIEHIPAPEVSTKYCLN